MLETPIRRILSLFFAQRKFVQLFLARDVAVIKFCCVPVVLFHIGGLEGGGAQGGDEAIQSCLITSGLYLARLHQALHRFNAAIPAASYLDCSHLSVHRHTSCKHGDRASQCLHRPAKYLRKPDVRCLVGVLQVAS